MSNLKEIKRKIKSVENTKKTTRAMKLVSTAKLNKAKLAAEQSKVYAAKINDILGEISHKLNKYNISDSNRYFNLENEIKVVDIVFVTADKGLCGGFNIQTIKQVETLYKEYKAKGIEVNLHAIGKRGVDFFRFKNIPLKSTHLHVSSQPTYEKATEIISALIEEFKEGKSDKIVLAHNGYKNMIAQDMKVIDIVPVAFPPSKEEKVESIIEYEPEDDEKILISLMNKYFEFNMYYALVDSLAAEHSARMQAMDNATNNATERVTMLTLAYNKARQEAITTELIEIISGVESIK